MPIVSVRKSQAISDTIDLVEGLRGDADFRAAAQTVCAEKSLTIDGAVGSSTAITAAALVSKDPLLVVLPRIRDVDDFAVDIQGLLETDPLIFPAWETLPREQDLTDAVFAARWKCLAALDSSTPPAMIITSLPALMQPVPAGAARTVARKRMTVGEEIDRDSLIEWLGANGFERVSTVYQPGEFSVRGSILDLFTPEDPDPVRIEFFGDEIESLRRFDSETQRKIEDLDACEITVASTGGEATECLVDSLPEGARVIVCELNDAIEEAKNYHNRVDEAAKRLFDVEQVLARIAKHALVTVAAVASERAELYYRLPVHTLEQFSRPTAEAFDELFELLAGEDQVLLVCHNEAERERLGELTASHAIADRLTMTLGHLERGFRWQSPPTVVLSDHELFRRTSLNRKPRRRKVASRAIDSFLELREGDLVVHLTKGIGRFRGMTLLDKDGEREEHLILEFRNGVRIYVPSSLIHLVQKYIGGGSSNPELSSVSGTAWGRKRERVAEAVADMAADMIRMQAARESKPGVAFPRDTEWQREFEAAFPYVETEDQLDAAAATKTDMQRERPTDRLICGDVGFGKTEVAMRAAFKAVDAGKQVAVLVPTTVLAEQHFRTFSERMAEFPVAIESLSRFKTKKQQQRIVEAIATGGIDIAIGTHRLVQKDVRFKDLGLVIVDEEQRFGVRDKEHLKRMRLEVDVLTMSATPIPRTLHMSLLGVRDISNLLTAPQDRQSVETRLSPFDENLIREAVNRELNRGGQVYFVHNRVHNIRQIASLVQGVVPEAKIVIGHGQMGAGELESAMVQFISGKADVLVCTTIIESGLDIPNANTIFINQANIYGLADLHQLRGRVGRYKHRAYCYLLLDPGAPLTRDAKKRLRAIEQFSELGAGFKISMRDLEIRGAGNILGSEQSGHIATVGYEMYCSLLEDAVRQQKGLPPREQRHVSIDLPVTAFIPEGYIDQSKQKIDIYRKLSLCNDLLTLEEVAGEIRDRYGPFPPEVARLLAKRELALLAWQWRIEGIRLEDGFAVFQYADPKRIADLAARIGGRRLRIVDARRAYLVMKDPDAMNAELLAQLKRELV